MSNSTEAETGIVGVVDGGCAGCIYGVVGKSGEVGFGDIDMGSRGAKRLALIRGGSLFCTVNDQLPKRQLDNACTTKVEGNPAFVSPSQFESIEDLDVEFGTLEFAPRPPMRFLRLELR